MEHDVFGRAFTAVLSDNQRRALATAGTMLVDEWYDAISELLIDAVAPAETELAAALPPAYLPRLTPVQAKQFHVCLITVLGKLTQPTWPRLACLAEELALRAIIDRAEANRDLDGELAADEDFRVFEDLAFDDTDHQFLFDPAWDGVDDTLLGQELGIRSLALRDCFAAAARAGTGPVHPYCVDEPAGDDG